MDEMTSVSTMVNIPKQITASDSTIPLGKGYVGSLAVSLVS